MSKTQIVVIDDRSDARKVVASVIDDALANLDVKNEWTVLSMPPLADLKNYPSWIGHENIGILLVDERLGEIPDIQTFKWES